MDFKPHLSPVEMLSRGVFGGAYFQKATEDDLEGLAPVVQQLTEINRQSFQRLNNFYEVRAGETYEAWMANGWIFPEDPLGWFHWYCRYDAGRRHERDDHQIRRHINYGIRWGKFARTQLLTRGFASSVVKQGLLQWGFEPMTVLHGEGE